MKKNKDYTVKNGRLINNAGELSTGIWNTAQTRKAIKRAEKVSIIIEANTVSNNMNKS